MRATVEAIHRKPGDFQSVSNGTSQKRSCLPPTRRKYDDEKITDILARKQEVFNAFANESAAAENVEVDEKSLGNIVQEEIDRINQKRNGMETSTGTVEVIAVDSNRSQGNNRD